MNRGTHKNLPIFHICQGFNPHHRVKNYNKSVHSGGYIWYDTEYLVGAEMSTDGKLKL